MWLAGADGCPFGWVVALFRPNSGEVRLRLVRNFAEVLSAPEMPEVIAVDIPIGLPERAGYGGRAAENAVRPLLGARQSSVFSVPSRAAVYASDYRSACETALLTSDPPRKVSKQCYMIAAKIREVDALLRADRSLTGRVFEVHPEVAFWRLNGERALSEPKKVKGKSYGPGLALRQKLLRDSSIPQSVLDTHLRGAGPDDVLDAVACAVIARRIQACVARPFPDPFERDAFGLPMAIWA
jgi:predicted RNase H-like nuclease